MHTEAALPAVCGPSDRRDLRLPPSTASPAGRSRGRTYRSRTV